MGANADPNILEDNDYALLAVTAHWAFFEKNESNEDLEKRAHIMRMLIDAGGILTLSDKVKDALDQIFAGPNCGRGSLDHCKLQLLLYCVRSKNYSCVSHLLSLGVNRELCDENGRTPLGWAIVMQDSELVKILLKGSSPNYVNQGRNGQFPLCLAFEQANTVIVNLLMHQNPNLDVVTSNGSSLL